MVFLESPARTWIFLVEYASSWILHQATSLYTVCGCLVIPSVSHIVWMDASTESQQPTLVISLNSLTVVILIWIDNPWIFSDIRKPPIFRHRFARSSCTNRACCQGSFAKSSASDGALGISGSINLYPLSPENKKFSLRFVLVAWDLLIRCIFAFCFLAMNCFHHFKRGEYV